jgi:hypothetical protein
MKIQAELSYDPYTREKHEDIDEYIADKVVVLGMVVLFVCTHHYLIQRNLSIIVIEK